MLAYPHEVGTSELFESSCAKVRIPAGGIIARTVFERFWLRVDEISIRQAGIMSRLTGGGI
jgi:hypothetical protein